MTYQRLLSISVTRKFFAANLHDVFRDFALM